MQTTMKRKHLLAQLRGNFKRHRKIVEEARAGYLKRAREVVAHALAQLEAGKAIRLDFDIRPPFDYSGVYQTCIGMLEQNTLDKVVLGPDEFRRLVQDQWDWSDEFIAGNSLYSSTALTLARGDGS